MLLQSVCQAGGSGLVVGHDDGIGLGMDFPVVLVPDGGSGDRHRVDIEPPRPSRMAQVATMEVARSEDGHLAILGNCHPHLPVGHLQR